MSRFSLPGLPGTPQKGIQVPFLPTSIRGRRPGARRSDQTADLESVQSEPRGFHFQDPFVSFSPRRRQRRGRRVCFPVFHIQTLWKC